MAPAATHGAPARNLGQDSANVLCSGLHIVLHETKEVLYANAFGHLRPGVLHALIRNVCADFESLPGTICEPCSPTLEIGASKHGHSSKRAITNAHGGFLLLSDLS